MVFLLLAINVPVNFNSMVMQMEITTDATNQLISLVAPIEMLFGSRPTIANSIFCKIAPCCQMPIEANLLDTLACILTSFRGVDSCWVDKVIWPPTVKISRLIFE